LKRTFRRIQHRMNCSVLRSFFQFGGNSSVKKLLTHSLAAVRVHMSGERFLSTVTHYVSSVFLILPVESKCSSSIADPLVISECSVKSRVGQWSKFISCLLWSTLCILWEVLIPRYRYFMPAHSLTHSCQTYLQMLPVCLFSVTHYCFRYVNNHDVVDVCTNENKQLNLKLFTGSATLVAACTCSVFYSYPLSLY